MKSYWNASAITKEDVNWYKKSARGEGGWAQLKWTDALSCARSHGDMLWGTIFKGRSAGVYFAERLVLVP